MEQEYSFICPFEIFYAALTKTLKQGIISPVPIPYFYEIPCSFYYLFSFFYFHPVSFLKRKRRPRQKVENGLFYRTN